MGFAELGEGGGLVMIRGRDSGQEESGQGSRVLQAARPRSHAGSKLPLKQGKVAHYLILMQTRYGLCFSPLFVIRQRSQNKKSARSIAFRRICVQTDKPKV